MPDAETDLARLLAGMRPRLDETALEFVTVPPGAPSVPGTVVRVEEDEGSTLVVPAATPVDGGRRAFRCARITLKVHSSLTAVGFLAAITRALADAGIAANPVSGFHHDHLFVPYDDRHDALRAVEDLTERHA